MSNMKELEGTELVLRITGAVESSNLAEFETQALAVIAGINTKLETDQDFVDADVNIKGCQLMENRISTARSTALANTAAIAELIQTTERLEAKFRETRLSLNRLVVTEKERRKGEVMNTARNRLVDRLADSPVKHGFVTNHTSITNAAKNKRSLKNLEEAVNEVIDAEILRLAEMEVMFAANIQKIEATEEEWPGLFPDRLNMALSAPETVDAIITGRVADHKIKIIEKAVREKEEKERKERLEAERIAKERADEEAMFQREKEVAEPVAAIVPPSLVEIPIPANPFTDFPIPPPAPKVFSIADVYNPSQRAAMLYVIEKVFIYQNPPATYAKILTLLAELGVDEGGI